MPAMQTTFARVKEKTLLSFLHLCSPHPGVIPSYPAAKRRRELLLAPISSLLSLVELDQSVRSRFFDKRYFAARK